MSVATKRKLRVLCLHGNDSNKAGLQAQIQYSLLAQHKQLSESLDLVYLDAPFVYTPEECAYKYNRQASVMLPFLKDVGNTDMRHWYRCRGIPLYQFQEDVDEFAFAGMGRKRLLFRGRGTISEESSGFRGEYFPIGSDPCVVEKADCPGFFVSNMEAKYDDPQEQEYLQAPINKLHFMQSKEDQSWGAKGGLAAAESQDENSDRASKLFSCMIHAHNAFDDEFAVADDQKHVLDPRCIADLAPSGGQIARTDATHCFEGMLQSLLHIQHFLEEDKKQWANDSVGENMEYLGFDGILGFSMGGYVARYLCVLLEEFRQKRADAVSDLAVRPDPNLRVTGDPRYAEPEKACAELDLGKFDSIRFALLFAVGMFTDGSSFPPGLDNDCYEFWESEGVANTIEGVKFPWRYPGRAQTPIEPSYGDTIHVCWVACEDDYNIPFCTARAEAELDWRNCTFVAFPRGGHVIPPSRVPRGRLSDEDRKAHEEAVAKVVEFIKEILA